MLLDDANSVKLGTTPVIRMMKEGVEVWPKVPVALTATATRWDTVVLTITPPAIQTDNYVIRRGATQIYTGTALTFTDTYPTSALTPSTLYTYTVDAIRGGNVTSSATASATTPARAAMVVTGSSPRWDQVALSWTDPSGGSIDQYKVKRSSTVVYTGTTKSYTDQYPTSALIPSTAYSYTVEALRAGVVISTSAAKSVTTAAHPDLGLTASSTVYHTVNLAWSAKVGSVDKFILNRSTTEIYNGTGTSKADTGRAPSTAYSYTLYAKRGTTTIKTDTASKTTPARPTSTGYAKTTKTHITSGGWTGTTQRNPEGGTLTFPYSGTMTSIVIAVWGYNDGNNPSGDGRVEPWVGGVARQHTIIGRVNVGGTNTFPLENIGFAAGTHAVGMRVGGSSPGISSYGQSEWDTWSPYSNYATQVYVDGINYWYYTALGDDPDELARQRALPWWDESLLGRDTHTVSWADSDTGEFIAVQITDKETGELLVEWGTVPPTPEPLGDNGTEIPRPTLG